MSFSDVISQGLAHLVASALARGADRTTIENALVTLQAVRPDKIDTLFSLAAQLVASGKRPAPAEHLPSSILTLFEEACGLASEGLPDTTLSEELDTQPAEWLVNNVMLEGAMTIIAGEPGSRKTFLVLDLAVCVATGYDFLDEFKVLCPGPVCLLEAETENRFQIRLSAVLQGKGIDPENKELIDTIPIYMQKTPANLADPRSLAEIKAWVLHRQARLLIVDTLAANMTFTGDGGENSTNDMSAVANGLLQICRETNCAVVVVHHTAVANNERSRGIRPVVGACAGEFIVKQDDGKAFSYFQHNKNRHGAFQPVAFTLESFKTKYASRYAPTEAIFGMAVKRITESEAASLKANQDNRSERVVDYLREHPEGAGRNTLAQIVGGKSKNTRDMIDSLVNAGVLARSGSGSALRYRLAGVPLQEALDLRKPRLVKPVEDVTQQEEGYEPDTNF